MDTSKPRNPNIALLEQRRALKILQALHVADAALAAGDTTTRPPIEAQSADDECRDAQTNLRRLRP